MLLMKTVTLVFVFTAEVQRLHSCFLLIYQLKLIMHVECEHAVFNKHSKFTTICYRKCNFVLIDVEAGLLLTFLASMKAKVHLYQKYMYSFSGVYT